MGYNNTKDRETYIYQLVEYGTHVPRYVGKHTIKYNEKTVDESLNAYLNVHIGKATNKKYENENRRKHLSNWIRSVLKKGGLIHIELLETVPPGGDWEEAEKRWIREYRQMKIPLTNGTEGGEGACGREKSKEEREKISQANTGREKSPATIEKLRLAKLGVPNTPESKEKNRVGSLGHEVTKQTREKISIGKTGKLATNQTKELMSELKIQWYVDHPEQRDIRAAKARQGMRVKRIIRRLKANSAEVFPCAT